MLGEDWVEQDPYDTLGDDNECDSDGDKWVVDRYKDEKEAWQLSIPDGEVDTLLESLRGELLSLAREKVPSLTPEDPSITDPRFRLCPDAFANICRTFVFTVLVDALPGFSDLSPSAVDFVQRIVEDVAFGDVIGPFAVRLPGESRPVRCTVVVGTGTTVYSLEADDTPAYLDDED